MRKVTNDLEQLSRPGEEGSGKKSKVVLTLPISSLVPLFVLAVAAIALAYIGGVMSGRHSTPAREVSVAVQPVPDLPADDGEDGGVQTILSARELSFARVLRGEQPITALPQEGENVPGAARTGSESASVKDAPGPDIPAGGAESKQTGGAPAAETPTVGNNDEIFDYVFQLGAFRDEVAADNLRQKLEGYGMRTILERSGRMYIVCVRLRGNVQRAAEVAAAARELRLGEPVIRERKKAAP